MHRRAFLISGIALAGSTLVPTALAAPRLPVATPGRKALKHLDELVQEAVSSFNMPGASLSVWLHGRLLHECQAGIANIETGARVTRDSVFRIGSVTKQFAAALILKLADAGKLALTDPAHLHLPFLSAHAPFTILELLNHTAGVHDADDDVGAGLSSPSHVELAQRIAGQDRFFDFPPGSAWLYSNANYLLVGAIIEKVAGMPLADAADALLFSPLGLKHTAFDAVEDIVSGRVSGYTPTGEADRPFLNAGFIDVARAGAAGAMRSTAADLGRWQHALFEGTAVPSSWAGLMTQPGRLRNGELSSTRRFAARDAAMADTQYGLGLMLDRATRDGSLITNHHGGINGFAAYLATHVESGVSYACLLNADTHPGLPLRDIRRAVFAAVLPT